MRSHFSVDIIIVYYYYCTRYCVVLLYCTLLIMYHIPRRQGYMRSDFSLNIIIILSYIITTVLYCTVLYCTLLVLILFYHYRYSSYPLLIMLSQI